jgi:hypothetical protein
MATPARNAFVSTVRGFEPPLDGPPRQLGREEGELSAELADGNRVRFNPDDPRSLGFAQVLYAMSGQHLPVYIEVDPQTGGIERLLIPHVAQVVGIRPLEEGGVAVELHPSHAVHLLRADSPSFQELERRLRDAEKSKVTLVVTETDDHEIIDVRDYIPDPEGPPIPFPKLPPRPWPPPLEQPPWLRFLHWIWWWVCWPWWWWFHCISGARAQQVFDAMSATSCAPLTVPPPCIPFLYPDDGCWGRAHEMCRLMINMGLRPGKVWIQGSLHTNTRNNPKCYVNWGWHVAPTLCVRRSHFIFATDRMVIDPSLFTTPVTEAGWKAVQGDPNASLTDTAASDFLFGATDPTYVQTNQVLATYRARLQTRAIQFGPPPYANCP